jgi:hypothetical protein
MDFTPATYTRLIETLQASGYSFQTITDFCHAPNQKSLLLRHNVDLLPQNALAMAKLEHGMGVVATYYFRAVPESWDEGVIREIAGLGHEVGYHYENLSSVVLGRRSEVGGEGQRSDVGGQRTEGPRDRGKESRVFFYDNAFGREKPVIFE